MTKKTAPTYAAVSTSSGGIFDVDALNREIASLDREVTHPGFWDDNEAAQKILQKRSSLQRTLDLWKNLHQSCEDVEAMVELIQEEEDDALVSEIEASLKRLR
ncbi:MAG: PCRF domain-containing protein, partial [Nitrospinaceae bacterium]|nr:PCRF domain-containing protein [Nitrospinaceae bacterium]NIR57719.1 PCRF domain-containing protein [Nitrospinaceae bacterium]NIS88179.1 PCRF domain-containing protein [Nitrospinaceae bacterium]NIT85061.1 PCRF domain-containing protein [Nitrospinaceae bacterium]NIU47219.1 PCRF domain-containing protein [Nitrospinaceae bacterium]